MPITKGNRPRPRVALVGNFEEEAVRSLGSLFPTMRMSSDLMSLNNIVSPLETDLIIIGPSHYLTQYDTNHLDFLDKAHVICFSSSIPSLPGPTAGSRIQHEGESSTEEYTIPELPLEMYNLLERDLSAISNARGLLLLKLQIIRRWQGSVPDDVQNEIVSKGTIFYDPHRKLPFATVFNRDKSNLGIAWLPSEKFSIVPWVELICTNWAKLDRERFPDFGDWTKTQEWMTNEEIALRVEENKLILELEKLTTEYKNRISDLDGKLTHASLLVNNGKRRLITAQGNELLEEVAQSFRELGYSVTIVDEELGEDSPKREDLRIQDPDVKNWEAIIEVRGHMKSSGQTSDLNRLPKFAKRYREETGKEPDKLIYVVNGQIELYSPQQRKMPFAAAPDDVKVFGELDGLIIWTLDLFKLLKLINAEDDKAKTRKAIREGVGQWSPT
jgi:hypothetical protein